MTRKRPVGRTVWASAALGLAPCAAVLADTGVEPEWVVKIDSMQATAVCEAATGGYIVAGNTKPPDDIHNTDVTIRRYDREGNPLWRRDYDAQGFEFVREIAPTAHGGCYVSASTDVFYPYGDRIWVMRLDENGDSLWTRFYGGPRTARGLDIVVTQGGGCMVAGNTFNTANGKADVLLIAYTAGGTLRWEKTYGLQDADAGWCALARPDGFLVVASRGTELIFRHDLWLLRTDTRGDTIWTCAFGDTSRWDYSVAVTPAAPDGYYVCAASRSYGEFDSINTPNMWLAEVSEDGDSLWSAPNRVTDYDSPMYMRLAGNGIEVILMGHQPDTLLWHVVTDLHGNVLAVRPVLASGFTVDALDGAGDGGVIAVGNTVVTSMFDPWVYAAYVARFPCLVQPVGTTSAPGAIASVPITRSASRARTTYYDLRGRRVRAAAPVASGISIPQVGPLRVVVR